MRVSYLEIYNEKIHDLLGEEEVSSRFSTAHLLHQYSIRTAVAPFTALANLASVTNASSAIALAP